MARRALAGCAAAALLLSVAVATEAATGPKLKQFKVPTPGSSPRDIALATDGNLWFTESFVNDQSVTTHNVARITPDGTITEFVVCDFCFPSEIVQGSDGILYFTKNDAPLGRITTEGVVLPDAGERFSFNGSGVDAHADDIWTADFNNHSVWRYDIPTGNFTQFPTPTPGSTPLDVAVDATGIVWFTEANGQIGRLDPATGVITEFPVAGFPRQIDIATDGAVWWTERFTPQAVGRLDPATGQAQLFPVSGGPEGIAPAAGGEMWFTQSTAGTVSRIGATGVVEFTSKAIKDSDPFGITVAADGDPWFTMLSADKIATLVQ